MSYFNCHMSRVTCNFFLSFLVLFFVCWKSGKAHRWRVCYQLKWRYWYCILSVYCSGDTDTVYCLYIVVDILILYTVCILYWRYLYCRYWYCILSVYCSGNTDTVYCLYNVLEILILYTVCTLYWRYWYCILSVYFTGDTDTVYCLYTVL